MRKSCGSVGLSIPTDAIVYMWQETGGFRHVYSS
jgi:hypothetical protein